MPPLLRRSSLLVAPVLLFLALLAGVLVRYAFSAIPLPQHIEIPSSAQVFDRNGKLIGTYAGEVTRFLIDTEKLPDHVGSAVIAAEDRDFYEHAGFSVSGILRAAWRDVTSGEIKQGGSTITQQYVKNAVLKDPERSVSRKAKELVLATKLERRYSKKEILGFYLNTVYFGRGAYGIEAAARAYFNKHARDLNLRESAFLASIVPSPSTYEPDENPRAALERRDRVLGVMRDDGHITEAQYGAAVKKKIGAISQSRRPHRPQRAAYFMEWLRKDFLYPRFGDRLYTDGLKIFTTLDLTMQRAAEDAIKQELQGEDLPEVGLVSMTPRGAVRAFVGGRGFRNVRKARGYNFATDSERQPGSAFKPFTLLAAIEQGISPASRFSGHTPKLITDTACSGPDGLWGPENYGALSYPTITVDYATTNSVNTVFAELITEIGPESVADLIESFGFRGPGGAKQVAPVCSLALGTLDVSPLGMARAYAALAGRGHLPTVMPLRFIQDADGSCIDELRPSDGGCKGSAKLKTKQAAQENSVDVLTQTLTRVVEGGTATAAQIGRPVAGKTGTTQNNRDAWFAGYVPQLATVVWMGYPVEKGPDRKLGTSDDYTPVMGYCEDRKRCRPVAGIEVTGGSFPARIWGAFMAAALEGVPVEYFAEPFDQPDIVINPPPPPPPPKPEKDEKKEESEDKGEDHPGNGNEGRGNGKGDDDDD